MSSQRPLSSSSQHNGRFKRFFAWLKSHHDLIKSYVEVVAILAAGGWALYQFVYVEKIKPSHEPPEISITTTLQEVGRHNDIAAISATITIQNKSKVRINVVSAYYNVSGYKIAPVDSFQTSLDSYSKKILEKGPANSEVDVSRYFNATEETMIQSGRVLKDTWLLPDEEQTFNVPVYIPANNFDLIKCDFAANVARDIEFIQSEWPVEDGILKGRIDILPPQGSSDPPRRFRDIKGEERDEIVNKYGLAKKESTVFLPLWQPNNEQAGQSNKKKMTGQTVKE